MGLLDEAKKQYGLLMGYIDANTPRATRPVAKPSKVINEGLINPNKYNAPAANRFKDSAFGLLGVVPGVDTPAGFVEGADLINRGEPLAGAMSIAGGVLPFVPATVGSLYAMHKMAGSADDLAPLAKAAKGQRGAIVYHGSPHKFDKFDMSKIGTGEGAQAYGHGLYFSESPDVARSYQATTTNGFGLPAGENVQGVANVISMRGEDAARKMYAELGDTLEPTIQRAKQAIADQSAFYKVDIPDEAIPRMLDWDKPLREQPEGVRVAVQDLGLPDNATGKDAYNALANLARDGAIARGNNSATTLGGSQSAASVDLQGYGIPGIRYLDGSSRNAGQGTSNFVLFDDQMPRILEVNGQPTGLLSWADEAAKKKPK